MSPHLLGFRIKSLSSKALKKKIKKLILMNMKPEKSVARILTLLYKLRCHAILQLWNAVKCQCLLKKNCFKISIGFFCLNITALSMRH